MSTLAETYPDGRTFHFEGYPSLGELVEFIAAMQEMDLELDVNVYVPADRLEDFDRNNQWQVGT